ncbi:MAG: PglZ domain-containing protein [Candidatus Methanomethyliaceae archaeon]
MGITELVRQTISEELNRQGEAGLVVWYDDNGTLASVVEKLLLENVRLLKFDGSYLAIRFELESQDPEFRNRWLVYVPEKPYSESWLRDWELLGIRLEMDFLGLLNRKFNLAITPKLVELLRRHPQNAVELVKNWENLLGGVSISETNLIDSLLALAFGLHRWQIEESLLIFLRGDIGQRELETRGLWLIWRERIADWTGWTSIPADDSALRERLQAAILLSELAERVPELVSRFRNILPRRAKRSAAVSLARTWRDRGNLRDVYVQSAQRVEREYELATRLTVSEPLLDFDTFPVIDELWRREILNSVAPDGSNFRDKAQRIAEIADKRKNLFWAKTGMASFWEPISMAARLFLRSIEAEKTAESFSKSDEFISEYTKENGWWEIDLCALQLASKFQVLGSEEQTRLLHPAWQQYGSYLNKANQGFGKAVQREGWKPSQYEFWSGYVEKKRTVIFLVDALRFDLVNSLLSLLPKGDFEMSLETLKGLLPSITEIGMSALLPGADEGLKIEVDDEHLEVLLEDQEIGNPQKRLEWLEEKIGNNGKVVQLSEVRKTDIKSVELLVVTSREIDRLGTFTGDIYPQGFLDIVKQISQTIRYLRDQGFEYFVVTSDHGFLFVPPEIPPIRIGAPQAKICKRRFAIGGSQESCFVAKAEEVGLSGREILTFPIGLSVFALPGETGSFLHGGLSLQECLIPVLKAKAKGPMEKVVVVMGYPSKLTSRIAMIDLKVKGTTLFSKPRRVIIEINGKKSEIVEMSLAKQEAKIQLKWLEFDEAPPQTATIELTDADTLQTLEKVAIPVQIVI